MDLICAHHTPANRALFRRLSIDASQRSFDAQKRFARLFEPMCEEPLKAEISEKARNEVCKLTDCAIRYKVDFQAGERQCVKRPAGFTADGRADRIFSRFDRICSFFRAYRLEKGSVSSMRIFAESVCQPYARFRKTGGFFACLRVFPVCQVYTQKNQYLCNQGGSVCIR